MAEQYRIAVLPPAAVPWLGQEIAVTLRITSAASQRPVANLPVSLESSDMWISTPFGFEVREGRAVDSRTGTDGSVRLRLRTVFDERLTVDQFDALNESLRALDSDAAAPGDMREQFLELARRYEDEHNRHLRSAIDIVYRSMGRRLTETANSQDHLHQWQFHTGLLRIYLAAAAQPGAGSAPVVDATAAQVGIYRVSWKQWLMPWHQLYLERLSDSGLGQGFAEARERHESEAGLTADILGQAYRFVAGQSGLVGEVLGKRVIDREIRNFLAREISSLPAESRRSMFPSLSMAGNSIRTTDTGTLALVNQTRADVEGTMDERISDVTMRNDEALGRIGSHVDQLDTRLGRQDGRFSELQSHFDNLRGDLGSLGTGLAEVRGSVTRVTRALEGIDGRVLELNARVGDVGGAVERLGTNFSEVTRSVETLNESLRRVDRNVGRVEDGLRRLDNDLGTVKTNLGSVQTDLGKVQTDVRALDNRTAAVDRNVSSLNAQIGNLDDRVTNLSSKALLTTDIKRDARGRFVDIRTGRIG